MKAFYNRHISPSSPHRAKLSVHLIAQSKSKEPTLDECKAQTLTVLQTVAKQEKLELDIDVLNARVEPASSKSDLPQVISAYLTNDLKLDEGQVDKIADEVAAALGLADSGVPPEVASVEKKLGTLAIETGDPKEPILITDVHAFKAGLFASTGVRPVRNLEDFMEDAAKL